MALLERNLKCDECGAVFDGARAMHKDPNESWRILCSKCLDLLANDEKAQFLNKMRAGKTIEERVEQIEEFVYYVTKGFDEMGEPDKVIK